MNNDQSCKDPTADPFHGHNYFALQKHQRAAAKVGLPIILIRRYRHRIVGEAE